MENKTVIKMTNRMNWFFDKEFVKMMTDVHLKNKDNKYWFVDKTELCFSIECFKHNYDYHSKKSLIELKNITVDFYKVYKKFSEEYTRGTLFSGVFIVSGLEDVYVTIRIIINDKDKILIIFNEICVDEGIENEGNANTLCLLIKN